MPRRLTGRGNQLRTPKFSRLVSVFIFHLILLGWQSIVLIETKGIWYRGRKKAFIVVICESQINPQSDNDAARLRHIYYPHPAVGRGAVSYKNRGSQRLAGSCYDMIFLTHPTANFPGGFKVCWEHIHVGKFFIDYAGNFAINKQYIPE